MMRYLPLIWSALTRKPARAVLTLLSVTVAFTLFGLMIGLNATFDEMAARARADRIFTNARFGGNGMPIAVAHQIAAIPGVKVVTAVSGIPGYVQDPKNQVFVLMMDENLPKVFGDWGVTEELWDVVRKDRTGIVMSQSQADRWHKKVGDTFTMISKQMKRTAGALRQQALKLGIGLGHQR